MWPLRAFRPGPTCSPAQDTGHLLGAADRKDTGPCPQTARAPRTPMSSALRPLSWKAGTLLLTPVTLVHNPGACTPSWPGQLSVPLTVQARWTAANSAAKEYKGPGPYPGISRPPWAAPKLCLPRGAGCGCRCIVTMTRPCQGVLAPLDHVPVFLRPNPACQHTVLRGVIHGQPQIQPHTSASRPARGSFRVALHDSAAAPTPRTRAAPADSAARTNLPLTALDPDEEREPPRDTHVTPRLTVQVFLQRTQTNCVSREKLINTVFLNISKHFQHAFEAQ